MFFIKSKNLKTNIYSYLAVFVLFGSLVIFESYKAENINCECIEDNMEINPIQAGPIFGKHKNKKGECVQRFLGITVKKIMSTGMSF